MLEGTPGRFERRGSADAVLILSHARYPKFDDCSIVFLPGADDNLPVIACCSCRVSADVDECSLKAVRLRSEQSDAGFEAATHFRADVPGAQDNPYRVPCYLFYSGSALSTDLLLIDKLWF